MRIGICGGTFDPLHNGHAALVHAALASGQVDRVLVIPSGTPPHKRGDLVSMACYRYEMARRAFAGEPNVDVSDIEILREGPSYTLDTARLLQASQPGDTISLIYGSDILRDIERWHQPVALLAGFPLLLADRGGVAREQARVYADRLRDRYGAQISFFDAPSIDLSATIIRQRAARGDAIGDLVPRPVSRFVSHHGLYLWQEELAGIEPVLWEELRGIERQLWTLLNSKRLLHSLNVLRYSFHLAIRHGVDLAQAARASILHDCAKCLPESDQVALALQGRDTSLLTPPLAHGPAGAVLARQRFGIEDEAVLKAIRYHTTGCARMTSLDQIVFIADKIEPARTYDRLDKIRRLAETNLDEATLVCLEEIGLYLERESLTDHPYGLAAKEDMFERLGKNLDQPRLGDV